MIRGMEFFFHELDRSVLILSADGEGNFGGVGVLPPE